MKPLLAALFLAIALVSHADADAVAGSHWPGIETDPTTYEEIQPLCHNALGGRVCW